MTTAPVSPIEHVVVIVKENHTFDNYFGTFPGANGVVLPQAPNPPLIDPGHTHPTWMKRSSDTRFEVQYKEADIPGYFDLARQFTLCDNFFSDCTGPSTPGHLMLVCADAPLIANPHDMYRPAASERFQMPNLPERLLENGHTWAEYEGYVFGYLKGLKQQHKTRKALFQDIGKGALPTVSWVYGDGSPNFSEHPTQNVTLGSQFTTKVVEAIAASPLWQKTMIVITWDDWGGWYDHVIPLVIELWNHAHAQHPADMNKAWDGNPWRYGSRVPCLVVGPYAKSGHISNQLNSHVSVPKMIEDLFGLQSLSGRDATSNGLTDCYDLTQAPLPPYIPKF
jgi:phospholipase C